jgi:hypothetical protein
MPSPLPANPRPSVVVAFTFTLEGSHHFRGHFGKLGLLGHDGGIDIHDVKSFLTDHRSNPFQQYRAPNTAVLEVSVRKVSSDIAVGNRSQEGISNGMQKDICIRMPLKAIEIRNLDATQKQGTTRNQRVNVVTESHSHRLSFPSGSS